MAAACPACGGVRVHHSRPRGWFERLRSRLTGFAPYRCHDCQWRGWFKDDGAQTPDAIREIQPDLTDAELNQLDPDDERIAGS